MANGRKDCHGISKPNGDGIRKLKTWIMSSGAGFDGNGLTVPCFWCRRHLEYAATTLDRWPLAGRQGGRYTRDNLVPACGPCNHTRDPVGMADLQVPTHLPKTFRRSLVLFKWREVAQNYAVTQPRS